MQISPRGLTLAALLLSAATAFAAESKFDKTLNVSGPVILSVSTGSGYIHVTPGSDSQVHIIGHVHAGTGLFSGGSAEDRVKQVVDNPPIEQSGNTITVGKHSNWIRNVAIDYEVTAPKGTSLTAASGSGDLEISGLQAPLSASTGSGNIHAGNVTRQANLNTGSGDINAQFEGSVNVKAETGSGSLRLHNVTGSLTAETGSGDLEVSGGPSAPWKLETGSGSVLLTTGSAAYTLDASTGSGSVHSDPPITTHGSLERHHLIGDVNGGGPRVRVETGSGDIRIR